MIALLPLAKLFSTRRTLSRFFQDYKNIKLYTLFFSLANFTHANAKSTNKMAALIVYRSRAGAYTNFIFRHTLHFFDTTQHFALVTRAPLLSKFSFLKGEFRHCIPIVLLFSRNSSFVKNSDTAFQYCAKIFGTARPTDFSNGTER